jgi:hypothetical protein
MDWRGSPLGGIWGEYHGFWQPPVKLLSRIKEISDYESRNNFRGVVIFSLTLRLLYPWGQNRLHSLSSRLGWIHGRSGRFTREKEAFIDGKGAKWEEMWRFRVRVLKTDPDQDKVSTSIKWRVFKGFRRYIDEIWDLYWDIRPYRLVIPYRHFEKKIGPIFKVFGLLDPWI